MEINWRPLVHHGTLWSMLLDMSLLPGEIFFIRLQLFWRFVPILERFEGICVLCNVVDFSFTLKALQPAFRQLSTRCFVSPIVLPFQQGFISVIAHLQSIGHISWFDSGTIFVLSNYSIGLRVTIVTIEAMSLFQVSNLYASLSVGAFVMKSFNFWTSILFPMTSLHTRYSITCLTTFYKTGRMLLRALWSDLCVMSSSDASIKFES